MVTLVGKDQVGIVAQVTAKLYGLKMNLGEASMTRLGGNFSIMMMVETGKQEELQQALAQCVKPLDLQFHVDPIIGQLHDHQESNVRITVSGADQIGIVARISSALAQKNFNILNLETDVGGSDKQPIYFLHIEGFTDKDVLALKNELEKSCPGVDVCVVAMETLFA